MSGKILKLTSKNAVKKSLDKLKKTNTLNQYLNNDTVNLKQSIDHNLSNIYKNDLLEFEELNGDLFSVNDSISLAHCVSADLAMGKGIAKLFKQKFNHVNELKSQNSKVGDVAFLKLENRFIFYLVTKEKYYQKPTYDTLKSSLIKMKVHIENNNIKQLAIPRLGCGLDKLDWSKVKQIIIDIFKENKLKIQCFELKK